MDGLTLAVALSFAGSQAAVQPVTYRVSGVLNKDAISDRIYGATADAVRFKITFEVDVSSALPVAAGTLTDLPNFPAVKFSEAGFHFPLEAVRSMTFRLSSGAARFTLADLSGDPSSPGAIFLTGSLHNPTGVHILLANSHDGYLEIGLPECTRTCRLKNGIVLDQAGPFGRASSIEIRLSSPASR